MSRKKPSRMDVLSLRCLAQTAESLLLDQWTRLTMITVSFDGNALSTRRIDGLAATDACFVSNVKF
ncbi:hypothetical protein AMATHDRAFT_63448 [Amanita thiersii Skay4041]|uniref:Uncharacterized protein n=1 Tax=Amanita thiersii Skay4041 TaxID=703135 RepID=A0A2A9NNQ8_9AGAR|nr:hypothetical protein AMATHDRAFT_63448 [Amanita thiersii Skay4041]